MNYIITDNNNKVQEVTLYKLYRAIRQTVNFLLPKWVLFLIVGIIFGLLGVLYAYYKQPVYFAKIKFATENTESSGIGAYAGIASQFGIDLGGGGSNLFAGDNILELMKSQALVNKALLSINQNEKTEPIINRYIKSYKLENTFKKIISVPDIYYTPNYTIGSNRIKDSILMFVSEKIIKNDLVIKKTDKKLTILEASVKSGDEIFSKIFLEELTSTVIDYYTDYRNHKSLQNVNILRHQADSVRRLVTGDIVGIATSNDLNINPSKAIVKVGSQRKQIDVQTNTLVYGELLKQLELAKIMLRKETPFITIIDTPILPLYKEKPGKLKTGLIMAILSAIFLSVILLARKSIKEFNSREEKLK